jgi:hypothetical protein
MQLAAVVKQIQAYLPRDVVLKPPKVYICHTPVPAEIVYPHNFCLFINILISLSIISNILAICKAPSKADWRIEQKSER